MKNKIILFLFCIVITGCYNYNELNEIAIISGLGIDLVNGKYHISAMISNGESLDSKENNEQTTLITGTGKTYSEAIEDVERKSPRELYIGHLNVVVIDENIAKDSLYDIIEALFRNPETLKKYYIILAKDISSKDILKTLSPLETFPAQNTSLNIISSKQNLGFTTEVFLSDFIYKIVNVGIEPVMPTIMLDGNIKNADDAEDLKKSEIETTLKMGELALFKDYKLISYATEEESKGINIINNEALSMILKTKCTTSGIDNIKSKIKVVNKEKIKLEIKAVGSINETSCKLDLRKQKVINKLNKEVTKKLEEIINQSIDKAKKIDSDIFGFGNKIYKKYGTLDYDFNSLDIDIDIDLNLKTKGSLETTLKEVQNEG